MMKIKVIEKQDPVSVRDLPSGTIVSTNIDYGPNYIVTNRYADIKFGDPLHFYRPNKI